MDNQAVLPAVLFGPKVLPLTERTECGSLMQDLRAGGDGPVADGETGPQCGRFRRAGQQQSTGLVHGESQIGDGVELEISPDGKIGRDVAYDRYELRLGIDRDFHCPVSHGEAPFLTLCTV